MITCPFDAFGNVVYFVFLLFDVDPFLVLYFQFDDVIIIIVVKLDLFTRNKGYLLKHGVVGVAVMEV